MLSGLFSLAKYAVYGEDDRNIANAASSENWDKVEQLFKSGEDPDSLTTKSGAPALFYTLCARNLRITALLLTKANPNIKSSYIPLHIACEGAYVDGIKLLLLYGADITAKNKRNKTALEDTSRNYIRKLVIDYAEKIGKIEKSLIEMNKYLSHNKESFATESLDSVYLMLANILKDESENIVRKAYVDKIIDECNKAIEKFRISDSSFYQMMDKILSLRIHPGAYSAFRPAAQIDNKLYYTAYVAIHTYTELLYNSTQRLRVASNKHETKEEFKTASDHLTAVAKHNPHITHSLFKQPDLATKLNAKQMAEIAKSIPIRLMKLLRILKLLKV